VNRRGDVLSVESLGSHERNERSTEVITIGFESLLDLLVRAVVAKNRTEHVIRAHIYCLWLDPFRSRRVERAVDHEWRGASACSVFVHEPVYRVATKITIQLRSGTRALAELVCAQARAVGDVGA